VVDPLLDPFCAYSITMFLLSLLLAQLALIAVPRSERWVRDCSECGERWFIRYRIRAGPMLQPPLCDLSDELFHELCDGLHAEVAALVVADGYALDLGFLLAADEHVGDLV
jgi:hypothetical protein